MAKRQPLPSMIRSLRSSTTLALPLALSMAAVMIGAQQFATGSSASQLAVVFPPWFDEVASLNAIVEAGGRLAGSTRLGNILIAFSTEPDFPARASALGAWFMFDANGLCGPNLKNDEKL